MILGTSIPFQYHYVQSGIFIINSFTRSLPAIFTKTFPNGIKPSKGTFSKGKQNGEENQTKAARERKLMVKVKGH